jgi:serine/threonine protein kinase
MSDESRTKPQRGGTPVPATGDGLAPGTDVGGWCVEHEIARGGFGTLYRARRISDGMPGALKLLHEELAASKDLVKRFRREAEIVGALQHPNICRMYETGELPSGLPYMALELLDGRDLQSLIVERGRLTVDEALALLRPIADALDAAHARGVIHRDVKASNVFLTRDGRVVLLDFGVAKLLDGGSGITASRQTLGTLAFMAPEQLAGEDIDHRIDIYALGVLTYQLLTGRLPFDARDPMLLARAQLASTPLPPSTIVAVSPAVDPPIVRALALRPEQRFASATAYVHALEAATRPSSADTATLSLTFVGAPAEAMRNELADRAQASGLTILAESDQELLIAGAADALEAFAATATASFPEHVRTAMLPG